ncbi:7604_t:CDS:2 [Racocetra fulgida]|uniref:7604_t:CDS:1 n=1 Tax=Racocetra fulgida TaxID=60492 RepID=A0A9N8W1B8_9GLOM|nr:7604_t:CDS:2 [Racocetra fulgida]
MVSIQRNYDQNDDITIEYIKDSSLSNMDSSNKKINNLVKEYYSSSENINNIENSDLITLLTNSVTLLDFKESVIES